MSDKENSFSTKKLQLARKSTAKAGCKRHFQSIQNESFTNENNIQMSQNQRSVIKRICLDNLTTNSFSNLEKPYIKSEPLDGDDFRELWINASISNSIESQILHDNLVEYASSDQTSLVVNTSTADNSIVNAVSKCSSSPSLTSDSSSNSSPATSNSSLATSNSLATAANSSISTSNSSSAVSNPTSTTSNSISPSSKSPSSSSNSSSNLENSSTRDQNTLLYTLETSYKSASKSNSYISQKHSDENSITNVSDTSLDNYRPQRARKSTSKLMFTKYSHESGNTSYETDQNYSLSNCSLIRSCRGTTSFERFEQLQTSSEEMSSTLSGHGYEADDENSQSSKSSTPLNASITLIDEPQDSPTNKIMEEFARARAVQSKILSSIQRLRVVADKFEYQQRHHHCFYLPTKVNSKEVEELLQKLQTSCETLEVQNSKVFTAYVRMFK